MEIFTCVLSIFNSTNPQLLLQVGNYVKALFAQECGVSSRFLRFDLKVGIQSSERVELARFSGEIAV